jgi:hypothetical protein
MENLVNARKKNLLMAGLIALFAVALYLFSIAKVFMTFPGAGA